MQENALRRFQRRLREIGSDRSPLDFMTRNLEFSRPEDVMNRTIIVNFADETTNFGCASLCPYCSWAKTAEAVGDIYPTDDGISRLLDDYPGFKVTISGGGDPLFKPERNVPRLQRIIKAIRDRGMLAEVVTRQVGTAMSLPNDLADAWSFSVDGRKHAETLRAAEDTFPPWRASMVCPRSRLVEESPDVGLALSPIAPLPPQERAVRMRKDWLLRTILVARQHIHAGAYEFLMREDSSECLREGEEAFLTSIMPALVKWIPSRVCSANLFLIGDRIVTGDDANPTKESKQA